MTDIRNARRVHICVLHKIIHAAHNAEGPRAHGLELRLVKQRNYTAAVSLGVIRGKIVAPNSGHAVTTCHSFFNGPTLRFSAAFLFQHGRVLFAGIRGQDGRIVQHRVVAVEVQPHHNGRGPVGIGQIHQKQCIGGAFVRCDSELHLTAQGRAVQCFAFLHNLKRRFEAILRQHTIHMLLKQVQHLRPAQSHILRRFHSRSVLQRQHLGQCGIISLAAHDIGPHGVRKLHLEVTGHGHHVRPGQHAVHPQHKAPRRQHQNQHDAQRDIPPMEFFPLLLFHPHKTPFTQDL